jgi:hypothetical protein
VDYSDGHRADSANSTHWQNTPWGRILIGLLLAQGLYYGLRHFTIGLILAIQPPTDTRDEATALWQLVVIQVLQGVTLLAGGILAGSGQRNGVLLGAVVGVWNGVLAGLTSGSAGQPFSAVALYGDPLVQTALGALAGWLGSAIWKPAPVEEHRGPPPVTRKAPTRARKPLFAGPLAPIRIIVGTALAVIGSLCATLLYSLIDRLSEGGPAGSGATLDLLVTMEIKAIALLAGGVLAGVGTHNGLKQGLCVGIVTTLILAALEPRAADQWLGALGLILVGAMGFCLVGGWFGSQLFPPVASSKRRIGASSMV